MFRRIAAVGLAALTLLLAAGCGAGDRPSSEGPLQVTAAFYPLQYVTERVGGSHVRVTTLTKPGGEPHDLELTPRDVATLADAPLVVYLAGYQPAVDRAVKGQAGGRAFDTAPAARLDRPATHEEHGEEEQHGEQHTGPDPHFWLDPTRLADVGDALARRLAEADPAHAQSYTANAAALRRDLLALDGELKAGLADCANRVLVTSHQAFGYLAARYGLTQVGISGLEPEAEPDAGTLARVAELVRRESVRTVYSETLVSPAITRTVASETGAKVAVLDPIEGLTDASAARDYFGLMRANLATLKAGQPCT